MENDIYLIAKSMSRGIVSFDLAKVMKEKGIPQASEQWYSQHINTSNIQIHSSYHAVEKYFSAMKNQNFGVNKHKELPEVMNIYAAFSLSEIHEMLMPFWGVLSLPVPLLQDNWRWVSVQYNIYEKTEVDATGKYLIALLENENVSLKDIYLKKKTDT